MLSKKVYFSEEKRFYNVVSLERFSNLSIKLFVSADGGRILRNPSIIAISWIWDHDFFVLPILAPKPAEEISNSSIYRVGMLSKKDILVNRNQRGEVSGTFLYFARLDLYRSDDLISSKSSIIAISRIWDHNIPYFRYFTRYKTRASTIVGNRSKGWTSFLRIVFS